MEGDGSQGLPGLGLDASDAAGGGAGGDGGGYMQSGFNHHQQSGFDPFLAHSMGFIQLSVKIADSEINGGARYRAWAHHRERVLERLGGWQLIAAGPDYATFNIPQSVVLAAASERQAKIPKEERRYWGDKADFCRCLETVLNEMEPRADKASAPSAYQLFCQDKRLEHKEQGHATLLEAKDLGSMWRGLSDEERKSWCDKSQQMKLTGRLGSALHDMPRQSSQQKAPAILMNPSPPQLLSPAVQHCCLEIGLDPTDLLVRLLESRQPEELLSYERRLRLVMHRVYELQYQITTSHCPRKRKRDPQPPAALACPSTPLTPYHPVALPPEGNLSFAEAEPHD